MDLLFRLLCFNHLLGIYYLRPNLVLKECISSNRVCGRQWRKSTRRLTRPGFLCGHQDEVTSPFLKCPCSRQDHRPCKRDRSSCVSRLVFTRFDQPESVAAGSDWEWNSASKKHRRLPQPPLKYHCLLSMKSPPLPPISLNYIQSSSPPRNKVKFKFVPINIEKVLKVTSIPEVKFFFTI